MAPKRYDIPITVNADGDATAYTPVLSGRLAQIHYVKQDYEDGVDFLITSEATGLILWDEDDVNSAAIRAPRLLICDTAGEAKLYGVGLGVYEAQIVLANDRVKIVVASGGDSTTANFHVVME